jgi:hypothetical protein
MQPFRTPLGAIAFALATFASAAPSFAFQHPSSTGAKPKLGLADDTLESPADLAATQLTLGHAISFEITGAAPGGVAWLLASAGGPATPICLHCVRVIVDPLAFVLLGVQGVGATGQASFHFTVPSSLLLGTSLHVQAFLVDLPAGSVHASNGLALTTAGEPFTTLAAGGISHHPQASVAGAVIVTTEAEWQTFWTMHSSQWWAYGGPGATPPVVDFTTHAVLCTFAGAQPSTAFGFQLESVVFAGTSLLGHGIVFDPGPGCAGGDTVIYPFEFVLIDAAVVAPAQLWITHRQGTPCG